MRENKNQGKEGGPEKKRDIYVMIGATNHSKLERVPYDYYATEPKAIDHLLEGGAVLTEPLWECSCGEGHLSKRLEELGFAVKSTDLIDRGYGVGNVDFLKCTERWNGDIITNPPYKYATEFILHGLELLEEGHKIFLLLKVQSLEGKARRKIYDTGCLKHVYVFSGRINCARNGDFKNSDSSAVAYAWFEFEKGYAGATEVSWIN